MNLQAGIRARLLADAGVAAIVATRVSWMERPQGKALPAITLQVVSDGMPQHLKGYDPARGTRVQIDCWAPNYAKTLDLAVAVIAAVSEPATVSGKQFGRANVDGQVDLGEDVNGTFVYRRSVDMIFWHKGD